MSGLKIIGVIRSGGSMDSKGIPKEMELYTWRGSLFNVYALRQVGLPKKEYFIYGEDLEHAIRLERNGFSLYWAPSSKMIEVRDGKTNKSVFGETRRVYLEPFRFYYAFRNEIHVYLRYWYPRKLIRIALYAFKTIIFILVFQTTKRMEKIAAIFAGILDGIRGKLGKNIKYLPH